MRKEKALIVLLRGLVDLLADESAHNPEFSSKLDTVLSGLPERTTLAKNATKTLPPEHLPNIYAELNVRGETDFRLWLRNQPIPVLRSVIRTEDLDAPRRTTKWKEAEKLADFITEKVQARQARGSAFIGRGSRE